MEVKLGLKENKSVKVRIKGERSAILENIPVRIKDNYVFSLHLDTDEANAVLAQNSKGEIIK
jgi:propanediol utilization protein